MTPRKQTAPSVILTLCVAAVVLAQGDGRPPEEPTPQAPLAAMFQPLAGFDWDAEAERVRVAAERLWRRNGWTDESDLFARDVACEVTRIPPWDVPARLDLFSRRVAERYGLADEPAGRLRQSIVREASAFLVKNARPLLEYGNEALQARAQGQPYTPEQVQRWAQVIGPLLTDARGVIERLSAEMEPSVPPDKKPLLQRDLASAEKRTRFVDEMSERWKRGEWTPEHWGLEADPIQNGAMQNVPASSAPPANMEAQTPAAAVESVQPMPTTWLDHDPKTWLAYVRHVEKRFTLDSGQRTAAASIHAELQGRALDYLTARRAELDLIPVSARSTHPGYEPVRVIFAELQQRLDALPTTMQRSRAAAP